MKKKKLFAWCDFLADTGFGHVAENLLGGLHRKYDIQILAINHHGEKHYDTNKYFVYPVSRDDMLGMKRLIPILKREQPEIVFLFQDVFHISDIIDKVKKVLHPRCKIVVYFPVDGQPFSRAWENVLNVADSVITYSDWAVKVIKDRFPNYKKEIHRLYHGVDNKVYHPISYKRLVEQRDAFNWDDKFTVVNINRFQPRKCIPLTLRAFSMFAKGYKICKCGNHMPIDRSSCDLNPCSKKDIKKVVRRDRKDVFLYLHMMAAERQMGPGRTNILQNHLLNASFTDDDVNKIIGINAANIYAGEISNKVINEIYNTANINISSSLGEGSFIEGTLTLTHNGWKPIEEVQENDEVYTHNGNWQKVNKTLHMNLKGRKLITFKTTKTTMPVICTYDHPWYTINKKFVKAEDINVGDYLALRKPQLTDKAPIIIYKYKRYKVNYELAKFFGLYLAEGSLDINGVRFGLHEDEKELIKFVHMINEKYFDNKTNVCKIKGTKGVSVEINDVTLRNIILTTFGKTKTKKISNIYKFSNKDIVNGIVDGYFAGNGDIINTNHRKMNTSVKTLCFDLRDCLMALGYVPSVRVEKGLTSYIAYKELYELKWTEMPHKDYKEDKEFIYIKVTKKVEETCTHNLLAVDLEVPGDESYTVETSVVKNCGLSLLEAAAVGTPSIAPANSAIPEMLRNTGHLIPNIAVMNQALDNGHIRPVVDSWKMAEALEIEYQKWKKSPNEKDIDMYCVDNINNNFRWEDKIEKLDKIFTEVMK